MNTLMNLAWHESLRRHNENADADGYGCRNGHEGKHGRCSHLDCSLVRLAEMSPPTALVEPREPEPPRYFTNIEGFKDDTAYVRVDADGRCFAVPKEAEEWLYTATNLDKCVEKVQRGIWRELTQVEAMALVERASPDSVIDCQCPNCQPPAVAAPASPAVVERAPLEQAIELIEDIYGTHRDRDSHDSDWDDGVDVPCDWCENAARTLSTLRALLLAWPSSREREKEQ